MIYDMHKLEHMFVGPLADRFRLYEIWERITVSFGMDRKQEKSVQRTSVGPKEVWMTADGHLKACRDRNYNFNRSLNFCWAIKQWWELTNPEMSMSCKSCLSLVYIFFMYFLFFFSIFLCLCVVYVLSMCCLCIVYVLSMCFLCLVYVLSMCFLCVVYVLCMCCLCVIYVLSMYIV